MEKENESIERDECEKESHTRHVFWRVNVQMSKCPYVQMSYWEEALNFEVKNETRLQTWMASPERRCFIIILVDLREYTRK